MMQSSNTSGHNTAEELTIQKLENNPTLILDVLETSFHGHPFSNQLNADNIKSVMQEYATMSQLFPYLQAKAIGEVALQSVGKGSGVTTNIEITTAVATFLIADETGVYNNALRNGNAGLSKILDTKKRFHYQFLLLDMITLFKNNPPSIYTKRTMNYLHDLYTGLASTDDIIRCATMIAFESHAEKMITSLWNSVHAIFPNVNKESLIYFQSHVGGDDPAEAYHVAMTQSLIKKVVSEKNIGKFITEFKLAYQRNLDWCKEITISI